jgi:phosphoglycolate phosphatase
VKTVQSSPTIVFDLDGTLVDTAPDLVATLNLVLAREGLPPVPFELARNMVGGGARLMIERALVAEGRSCDKTELDRLVGDFLAYYGAHIADHSKPFDGVAAALDALTTSGCRLAVCTNKLEWLSLRLLDSLGLQDRFAAVCGPDTFGVGKPDPAILLNTIRRAGGHAGCAVMVGDSITDIATARAAGVPVVAVEFGYTDVPVRDLGPDRVIGRFADLTAVVFQLLGVRAAQPCAEIG